MTPPIAICPECRAVFLRFPPRQHQVFCSRKCCVANDRKRTSERRKRETREALVMGVYAGPRGIARFG